MKQGKPLITFTILIFAAVIALYLGYYIFGALNEPYQTAQVYSYKIGRASCRERVF